MILKFGEVLLIASALEDKRQAIVNKLTASRHTLDGSMGAAAKRLIHRDDLMIKVASLESQLADIDRLLVPVREEAHRLMEQPSRLVTKQAEVAIATAERR